MIKLTRIEFKSLLTDFNTVVVQLHRFGNNNALKRLIYIVANVVEVLNRNQTVNLTVILVDSQVVTDKTEQSTEQ